MAKRLFIWGAPSHAAPGETPVVSFERSGKNFGNILIGNAVHTFLSGNSILGRHQVASPEEVNERCDHVVIPAANFLWKDFDFGWMVDFLEKTKLPITIVGVGAQTSDRTMTSPIHPNTLRLMYLISDRSASLGVRGYYTAEVLAANGIHNVRVIGCPSIYTNRSPTLKIDRTKLVGLDSVSMNGSRRVYKHAFNPDRLRAIENALLKLALEHNSTFVAQDEMEEISLSTAQGANAALPITNYFNLTSKERVIQFFREKTRYFCDYAGWASYIRTQSASIGSRFHGNLVALVNGVPAVFIVHDSRTMEMCTLIGAPKIHINDPEVKEWSPAAIKERLTASSFDRFEASYAVLYRRFVDFMNENELPHNLPVASQSEAAAE